MTCVSADTDATPPSTRRQMQLKALKQAQTIKAKIYRPQWEGSPVGPTLTSQELETLGIRKLPALDVDESSPVDQGPLFFRPFRADAVEDFPAWVHSLLRVDLTKGSMKWQSVCRDQSCPASQMIKPPESHCSITRLSWFMGAIQCRDTGIFHQHSEWNWNYALQELVDNSNSYRYWATEALSDDWTHCYGTMAFFHISENEDEDEDKAPYLPHMAVAVCDSIRQSSETLTSEVAAALQMLIYRLHIGDFVDHHTLPVLVYSFQHDMYARVTQMHWDSTGFSIRQSRLLDLRGPEPTPDAYLLIRWMVSHPVRSTSYELSENERREIKDVQWIQTAPVGVHIDQSARVEVSI